MKRAVFVAGVVLTLAGCGGGTKHTYTADAVQNYMDACSTLRGGTPSVCRCTLNQLEKHLNLDEFKSITRGLRLHTLNAKQNQIMLDATLGCVKEATK